MIAYHSLKNRKFLYTKGFTKGALVAASQRRPKRLLFYFLHFWKNIHFMVLYDAINRVSDYNSYI